MIIYDFGIKILLIIISILLIFTVINNRNIVNNYQDDIADLSQYLDDTEDYYDDYIRSIQTDHQEYLIFVQTDYQRYIDKQSNIIDNLTNKINNLTNKIDEYENIDYNLSIDTMIIRPTYQQVVSFLSRDHTDIKRFTESYICTDFGNKLIANARDEGIFGCSTILYYLDKDTSHMLVAFNTIDRGIIYVEPQNDDIMTKDFGIDSVYWNYKVIKITSCWD